MKRLLAGPWVGELGWLLMMWQGHLRTLSKDFDEVVIAGEPGCEYIYEDFCTEYIPYTWPNRGNTDCELCDNQTQNHFFIHNKMIQGITMLFPAQRMPSFKAPNFKEVFGEQTFIKYGEVKEDLKFDIVVHDRSTSKCGTNIRNWESHKWKSLVNKLNGKYKIASIGKDHSSQHILL